MFIKGAYANSFAVHQTDSFLQTCLCRRAAAWDSKASSPRSWEVLWLETLLGQVASEGNGGCRFMLGNGSHT